MSEQTVANQVDSMITELNFVELSDGTKVAMPRLTNRKMLRLVKYIAGDGVIIYDKFLKWQKKNTLKEPAIDEKTGDQKKNEAGELLFTVTRPSIESFVEFILEELPDEKIAEIIAILLDKTAEEAEEMDFFDTSLLISAFLEKAPFETLTKMVKKIQTKFRTVSKEDLKKATQTNQTTEEPASVIPLNSSQQA